MKRKLLLVWMVLLGFTAISQEMVVGGGMENVDDWTVVELSAGNGHTETFNYTDDIPSWGDGGCLRLQQEGGWGNIAICQEITVTRGVYYDISLAVKSVIDMTETWVEVVVMDKIPESDDEVVGFPMRMAINTWDCPDNVSVDDVLPNLNCEVKVGEPDPVIYIEGEGEETVVLVIKVGSGGPLDILIDNVSIYGEETASYSRVEIVDFKVSPNPSADFVTVEAEFPLQSVEVFNVAGAKVNMDIVDNRFDISSLSNGIYLVKVVDLNNRTGIKKIVKN